MRAWINNIERLDVERGSISISKNLSDRGASAKFSILNSTFNTYDDVRIFTAFNVFSFSVVEKSITIDIPCNFNNVFLVGEKIFINIATNFEKTYKITNIKEENNQTKLYFDNNQYFGLLTTNSVIGRLEFGGVIFNPKKQLNNNSSFITKDIDCVGYEKIFDKSVVNDTYIEKNARYIINDFCNLFINKNKLIDDFNYSTDTLLRNAWVGSANIFSQLETQELDYSSKFNMAGSSWLQTKNIFYNKTEFTHFGLWIKIDNINLSNYVQLELLDGGSKITRVFIDIQNEVTYNNMQDGTWHYVTGALANFGFGVDNTANHTQIKLYSAGNGCAVSFCGLRLLQKQFFKFYPYTQNGKIFDNVNFNRVKPKECLGMLAEPQKFTWYIDSDRYIHFTDNETSIAPYTLSGYNCKDISIDYDCSKLINSVVVKGGDTTSLQAYSEVKRGDGVQKEWLTKTKFVNLIIKQNKHTALKTATAGTNSTTVFITNHGLTTSDYITNITRNYETRKVNSVLSPNSFTVNSITGQATGDTISIFQLATVGVEGIDGETKDFLSNYNEKSIRMNNVSNPLGVNDFLVFTYNEVVPILVQKKNTESINNIKTLLGYSDGIFQGETIVDQSISTLSEAIELASATLNKYSNMIITVKLKTNLHGLEIGQKVRIQADNIDQDFIIHSLSTRSVGSGGKNQDSYEYDLTCSTLLFGMLEILIGILRSKKKLKLNENELVTNIFENNEVIKLNNLLRYYFSNNKSQNMIKLNSILTKTNISQDTFVWGPTPDITNSGGCRWNFATWG